MNVKGVIYRDYTIEKVISVPDEKTVAANCSSGCEYLLTEDDVFLGQHYVANGAVVGMRTMQLVIPGDLSPGAEAVITGIPTGSKVVWPDKIETLETDGVVQCVLPYTGSYEFVVSHPKYFTEKVMINVES